MIHLTLQSYYDNAPVDPEDEDHPDGLLWPVTEEEIKELPQGTMLEDIDTGNIWVLIDIGIDCDRTPGGKTWGIRGRREEEMV